MYVTNFNFLSQIGGELCEEQTQEMVEMKKADQKTISLGLREVEMGLKSLDPQKAHLRYLLNVHTKFQLLSPIWKGNRKGTALFELKKGEIPYLPS